MLLPIDIGAICDPLQLVPIPGKLVLDVDGPGRVMTQLILVMWPDTEIGLGHAKPEIPVASPLLPVGDPLVRFLWPDEVLHLHLLELPGAEHELPGSDLA